MRRIQIKFDYNKFAWAWVYSMPNLEHPALIIAEILTFKQTDTHAENTQSILSKNIKTLWGLFGFILGVTYISTKLVYPFFTDN